MNEQRRRYISLTQHQALLNVSGTYMVTEEGYYMTEEDDIDVFLIEETEE